MKKSYGQHFLKDESLITKIVAAAQIDADELVVEVGPGQGALTAYLPQDRCFLIEADADLIGDLQTHFPETTIVHADATSVDYKELIGDRPWLLIGNLPYNAANAIIMNALKQGLTLARSDLGKVKPWRGLRRLIVMVQKEVAQRMIASPGTHMSVLSVAVQLYGTPTRVMDVKPGSFQPPPKVMSSVIRLDVDPKVGDPEPVIALASAGFSARRKQLHKNLAAAGITTSQQTKDALEQIGLRSDIRAQDLSVDDWVRLAKIVL